MLKRLVVGALLAFAVDPSLHAEAGSWKPLFNGKDLSGWHDVVLFKEIAVRPLEK